jgi:hypothetical protein
VPGATPCSVPSHRTPQVDTAHRPSGYGHVATFHPTFLYESL